MRPIRVLLCFVALLAFATASAFALEINVGPDTLVLSSNVRHITVHSDYPFKQVDRTQTKVEVYVDNELKVIEVDRQWANSIGNLMVRCSKKAVGDAVGDFDGAKKTVKLKLTVVPKEGTAVSASDTIVVKK